MQVITGWVGCNVCSPHALQVQCPNLPSSVCEAARRMGGDKVRPALELVGCAALSAVWKENAPNVAEMLLAPWRLSPTAR
jgi:hypothetical protein